jgi:hypothetical protein
MSLLGLSFNFAWETVCALFVVETLLECIVFGVWLLLDCGMAYGALKYGRHKWEHSSLVKSNAVGHWAFAKWWIDNGVGKWEGKFIRGISGRRNWVSGVQRSVRLI